MIHIENYRSITREDEMKKDTRKNVPVSAPANDPTAERLKVFSERIGKDGKEKTQSDRLKTIGKALGSIMILAIAFVFVFSMIPPDMALAAGTEGAATTGAAGGTITSGFTNLLDIVKSLVSSIGTIVLLWGFFEWGTSMQSQDGVMQSSAFKRIGGGLVMVLAPQLISVFL